MERKELNTNDYMSKKFGKCLKRLRIENHLTQEYLASLLNVGVTTISNYETGRNQPNFEKLYILSQHFKVSIDELLCNDKFYENVDKTQNHFKEFIPDLDTYETKILSDIFHVLQDNGLV